MIDRSEWIPLSITMMLAATIGLLIFSAFTETDRIKNHISQCENAGGQLVYGLRVVDRNKHEHYACMRKDLFVEFN